EAEWMREPNPGVTIVEQLATLFFDTTRRAPRLAGRGLIWLYRYSLSPFVGYECRHLPTCSHYAEEAIEHYGLVAGRVVTSGRLLRCQPFGTSGLDFVPERLSPSARWYLPWRYARWRGTNAPPNGAPLP